MKFHRKNVQQSEMGDFAQKIIAELNKHGWQIESVTEHPGRDVTIEIEGFGSFSICETDGRFCLYRYVQNACVPFGLSPSVSSKSLTELISAAYNSLTDKARKYTNPYLRVLGV